MQLRDFVMFSVAASHAYFLHCTRVFCIYSGQHSCQIGVKLSLNSPPSPRLCGAFELPVLLEYSRGRGEEVARVGSVITRVHSTHISSLAGSQQHPLKALKK